LRRGLKACAVVALLLAFTLFQLVAAVSATTYASVYYFDAVQGYWYAVNTNKQPFRVFYFDNNGNIVFVTAYWWDANPSYIIFQAPCSCRIYLRKEPYTLSTLSTVDWFALSEKDFPEPSSLGLSGSAQLEFVTSTAAHAIGSASWVGAVDSYSFVSYTVTSFSYRPAEGVTVSATATWSVNASATLEHSWSTWIQVSNRVADLRVVLGTPIDSIASYTLYTVWGGSTYSNSLSYYYGDSYPYKTASYGSPTIADPGSGVVLFRTSAVSSAPTAPASMTNYVSITARFTTTTSTSTTKVFSKSGNSIVAPNGNTIHVYDSLAELTYMQLFATSSSYSYYLYTQQISISFNETRDVSKSILVPLNTQSISTSIRNPNPAVHIALLDSWTSAHLINYGGDESFLVFTPPRISNVNGLNISLVYNYPIIYTQPQLAYVYAKLGDVLQLIAVSGSIVVYDTHVYVEGSITLPNYVGSTVVFKVNATASNYSIVDAYAYGNINEYIVIQPSASTLINGSIAIESMLVLYNTITELNYTTTVEESAELKQWTMNIISYTVSGEIIGSWAYRIPVYITLAEFPTLLTETGFVFRLELPVSDWVKSGLLSPALEDLIIVDSAMKPCLFYIYRITGDGRAVVFVRYDNVISSNTIVLYILLKNTQLWGSGRTFSTLAAFDSVNVKDFVDDFGFSVYYTYLAYNAMLVTVARNTNIKLGKTWYDFVAINNTHIYEQHGSTMFWNTSYLGFQEDDEILIYISRDAYNDILVYRNAKPLTSFRLSDFSSEPAYYAGYKDVKFVARFKMLIYSYSIGQLVGGFEKPQTVVKYPLNTVVNVGGDPWSTMWSLAPFMLLLIVLAVVVKLVSGGGGARAGGGGVKLP